MSRIALSALVVTLGLLWASSAHATPPGWWDLKWPYVQWISVSTGAATPAGYTVSLTVDHAALVGAGKSLAGGDDVRVAYWNGSYWIELDRFLDLDSSWNSTTTTIWFKTQAPIPASSTDDNYGLFYGNMTPGLPPANPKKVFFFYDGYESGDFSAWDLEEVGVGGSHSVVASPVHTGSAAAQAVSGGFGGFARVRNDFAAQGGFHSTLWVYIPAGWSGKSDIRVLEFRGGGTSVASLSIDSKRVPFITNSNTGIPNSSPTALSTDAWHRLEMKVDASTGALQLFQDDSQSPVVSLTGETFASSNIDANLENIVSQLAGANSETMDFDDAFDRIWMEMEPTASVGGETAATRLLTVSEGTGTITVTSPNYFELVFNEATGGGIDTFFDLVEDSGRTNDLAGGVVTAQAGPRTLFHHLIVDNGGGRNYNSSYDETGAKLDLLEFTPTRVKVRQEAFYRDAVWGDVLGGVKGRGDYSIYPEGKMALHWSRQSTTNLNVPADAQELGVGVHYQFTGSLNGWQAYSESGTPGPGKGADDFVLAKNNQPGALTDFLLIAAQDWAAAQDTQWFTDGGEEFGTLVWTYTGGGTIPAGSVESWDYLMYFKPTTFADNLDMQVTDRRDDYRFPDDLSTPTPGWGWFDASENTSGPSDFFNESEAAYTLDFDPDNAGIGLAFDIDGSTSSPPPRFEPFFKIRQWRSLQDPPSVTLNTNPLVNDVDYKADVKPIARAHFAQKLLWHSTLDHAVASTTPDVGTGGSLNGPPGFGPARYAGGAQFTAVGANVTFPSAGNFDVAQGAIELWYQPTYAHTDGTQHVLWMNEGDATHRFTLEKNASDQLVFRIDNSGTLTQVRIDPANYSWRAKDWVHLQAMWDGSAALGDQVRLFVNGVEPPHFDPATGYTSATMLAGTNFIGSNPTGNASASGVIDEVRVYGVPGSLAEIAHGGLLGHPGERLADADQNFILDFTPVDADKRGEFLYLGADAKFRGLNVALATPGVGSAPDLQWEYWNGNNMGWTDLEGVSGFTDETNNLTTDGAIYWSADPTDWSPYSINGGPDLYYVRAYLASGSYSAPPVEELIKTDILLFQYCGDIMAPAEHFEFGQPIPTAVELVSFTARGGDGEVLLEWETGSEVDNVGFHLYRAESETGPFQRITDRFIPGLGFSALGASYRYVDAGLVNGKTVFYKLEDFDSKGKRKLHGPVSATPTAGASNGSPQNQVEEKPSPSGSWITYGDPEATSLRVLKQDRHGVVLELKTEGFYAESQQDGSVRLELPGFSELWEPASPAIPVKRTRVEVLAGLGVRIASIETKAIESFSLRPMAAGEPTVQADRRRGVRAARRRRKPGRRFRGPGLYPEKAARLVATEFQEDVKKALVELAPLRWDRSTGQLLLARRLLVRLVFDGRAGDELSLGGSKGRRRPARSNRKRTAWAEGRVAAYLLTDKAGLYAVPFEDLFATSRSSVPTNQLALSHQGQPVASHTEPHARRFGPGSVLYFLSEGEKLNPYGQKAVVELTLGAEGQSMPLVSAFPSGMPLAYVWETLSFEENHLYQARIPQASDFWLWDWLQAPVTRSYPITLDALAPSSESARLRIWLQGGTDLAANPDHHVRVYLNHTFIDEVSWDGEKAQVIDSEILPGILQEGDNLLKIENVGDTAADYSVVLLNRFELRYPRRLVADSGRLEADAGTPGLATVSGLEADAFLVDATARPVRWIKDAESSPEGLSFHAEAGHRYLLADSRALLHPEVQKPPATDLKRRRRGAQYVLIGPRSFLDIAQPLLEQRRRQELSTMAVAVEDVYAAFGHGEARPQAIKDFLVHAYHHWHTPPRYVLLFGDASFDFKDYIGTGVVNQVPPWMLRTTFFWTASDPAYAAVNGDDLLPDIAIGRLPAASREEAQLLVHKLLAYETSHSGLTGRFVLVADRPDKAGDFVANAEEIASTVLAGREVEKIYLSRLGLPATQQAILQAFDDGSSLMSYIGHGAIEFWDKRMLHVNQMPLLGPQADQPLLLTLNCLNGYFHFPTVDSLAEALLKAEGKGVIAAFSPTGLSLDGPAHLYHKALLEEILEAGHERLGDALLAAQARYAATGAFDELLSIYHLLGDPAMPLR